MPIHDGRDKCDKFFGWQVFAFMKIGASEGQCRNTGPDGPQKPFCFGCSGRSQGCIDFELHSFVITSGPAESAVALLMKMLLPMTSMETSEYTAPAAKGSPHRKTGARPTDGKQILKPELEQQTAASLKTSCRVRDAHFASMHHCLVHGEDGTSKAECSPGPVQNFSKL